MIHDKLGERTLVSNRIGLLLGLASCLSSGSFGLCMGAGTTGGSLASPGGPRRRKGRGHRRLSDASGLYLGWPGGTGPVLAFAGSPRGRWHEAKVLPGQCQASGIATPTGRDAGGPALCRTRLRGCQGRLWHGRLSGPGLASLAPPHGTRHGGADVSGQGATGQSRNRGAAFLQRLDRYLASQAAVQDRDRCRARHDDR